MKTINATCINVGPARFSYLNVFTPRMNKLRNELQYGVVILIPKASTGHLPVPKAENDGIVAAIKAAALEKFGEAVKKYDVPFKDGDAETDETGEAKHPGYWFLKASSGEQYPPKLIDGKRQEVTGGWESGDWGIAQVNFKAYDFEGKKGVGCYLRAIQFLYVDEHFGSGSVSVDSFDEVEGAAVAASAEPYDPFS